MKRTAAITVLAALSVLGLTGCSQVSPGGSAPSPSSTVKPLVVTPAQENSLRTQLRAVDERLDTPRVLPNAVQMCKMIQRGMPEKAQREQAERIFFRGENPAAAAPEGGVDRVLEVIRTAGFCPA
ncbi:hypothetical protein J2T22_001620 [Pseudarthrobacter defluvii]|uniref:DUF732 domain-containing protein n=1 Tax=Pseudarthrobacter defluvii TaxID=410837 RepID=A0ABT9UFM0_9MICC|nr:hypothetical protein [Pseudarthrobacter defluvii]MDQ0118442.1 hypothetical protein [Pseudarthrobacter defluvii]